MRPRLIHTALIILLLATGLTACTTFDPEAMRDMIRSQHAEYDTTTQDAIAGHVVDQARTLQSTEKIFVAHYDSTSSLQIMSGWYDRSATSDTALAIVVPDASHPRTLHVAMRSIEGIYPVARYPTMTRIKPIESILWTLLVLPALSLAGMTLGMFIGESTSPSRSWGPGPGGANGALIGALLGTLVWCMITSML